MFKSSLFALLVSSAYAGILVPQAGVADHVHMDRTRTPVGHNQTLNGIKTYVSLPPRGNFAKDTALLQLMDIFGFPKVDNALLADDWAAAGLATYMPDYLFGDAFPLDNSENQTEWFARHNESVTTPIVLGAIQGLLNKGITKIAVTGYCFGGLYATRITQNNTRGVKVVTMAHPALIIVPDDYEIVKNQSQLPVQIQSAQFDTGLTPDLAQQIDQVMIGYAPGYDHSSWLGVGHGFAISVNESDPAQVAAKEGAFDSSLNWILTHLANATDTV